jgi:peroxiredoxin
MVRSIRLVVAEWCTSRAFTSVLVAVLAMTSGAWAVQHRANAERNRPHRYPLGERLPAVRLKTADGRTVTLQERLGHRAAVIYVFSAAQCAGCSNLSLEFRILREAFPNMEPLLIGSGSSPEEFRPYFDQMGVPGAALVDEPRALLRGLGLTQEPVVLVADSTGRVVLVDPRSASQAAQYPMGRILSDLRGAIAATAPTSESHK